MRCTNITHTLIFSNVQSPAKPSKVPYSEAKSPGMPSAAGPQALADAADMAQTKQRVAMLERELADSERTHQLR